MARSFLFVAHDSSPFLSFYDDLMRKGLNLTGGNPPSAGWGCAFSPDGSRLAVAHNSSPFLTVYNTSDWSKVALTGGNPPGIGRGCAFSPLIGGTISNEDTTPITDALNVPVVRRVMALRRSDMAILAKVMSGSDGYYDIALLDNSEPVTVLFQADNDMENSVVADWVEAT